MTMPIAFILIGLVLIITGARDTYAQLGTQLGKDLTGQGNFLYWLAAIVMVGALGYIPALKTFSTWFMALILIALLLAKKNANVFSQLTAALAKGPVASAPTGSTAATPASPGGSTVLGVPVGPQGGQTLQQYIFGAPSVTVAPGSFADKVQQFLGGMFK